MFLSTTSRGALAIAAVMRSEKPICGPQVPNEAVLRGLVARGHGLEAISVFLQVDREQVLDWIVWLDLPVPHDRPMRRTASSKAWAAGDYFCFIENWLRGWHAASIGEQFGRSATAIWSKARWLGLPQRDRGAIFRPRAEALDATRATAESNAQPERCVTTATGEQLPIRRNAKRDHVLWTPELDAELANRYWANQHYEAIAAEWSLSARAIASRACRLELPRRERSRLVTHYDPSVIEANIAEARYIRRQCIAIPGWFFWGQKNGLRTSKRGRQLQAKAGGGYGLGIGHSIGSHYSLSL